MFNSERIVKILLFLASLIVVLITAGMVLSLMNGSIPVFKEYGLGLSTSSEWNPTEGREA
jgi:phosphate transport system permease protein